MPTECTVYCRSFKGVDAGFVAKFVQSALNLSLDSGGRPVWISKTRSDRVAKIKFADEIKISQLAELTEGKLVFKDEPLKCENVVASEAMDDDRGPKRQRKETIEEICLPWISKPYCSQLLEKKQVVVDALANALAGVKRQAESRGYLPAPEWDTIIGETIFVENPDALEEPVRGYRNKCEFTIAPNQAGEPDIGFMFARATNSLEPVAVAGENLMHVSPAIRDIVILIRNLVRDNIEKYCLFSHVTKTGYWRMASIRACPVTGQSQVLIQVGQVADGNEKADIETILTTWANENSERITSMYLQYNGSWTDTITLSEQHEMKLLFGPESIEMAIGPDVRLQAHPLSFFQTNAQACDLLYSKVAEWVNLAEGEKTTVFDVCCGVGSIGIFVAAKSNKSRLKIIGVDIVVEAIANARKNADLNGLADSCQYVAGRAEHVLPALIRQGEKSDSGNSRIVCIVDPPRVGLHKSVIKAIRENEDIKQLIYVSCNPRSLSNDLIDFCEPLTSSPDEEGVAVNARFVPIRAVAVDMFPNTVHCEVVTLLERP